MATPNHHPMLASISNNPPCKCLPEFAESQGEGYCSSRFNVPVGLFSRLRWNEARMVDFSSRRLGSNERKSEQLPRASSPEQPTRKEVERASSRTVGVDVPTLKDFPINSRSVGTDAICAIRCLCIISVTCCRGVCRGLLPLRGTTPSCAQGMA